jgi:hypothetical protein
MYGHTQNRSLAIAPLVNVHAYCRSVTHMYVLTGMCECLYVCVYMDTHQAEDIYGHTSSQSLAVASHVYLHFVCDICTYVYTNVRIFVCVRIYGHTQAEVLRLPETSTSILFVTYACMYIRMYESLHACVCMDTHQMRVSTSLCVTNTVTHAHAHACARACTHTHIRAHIQATSKNGGKYDIPFSAQFLPPFSPLEEDYARMKPPMYVYMYVCEIGPE